MENLTYMEQLKVLLHDPLTLVFLLAVADIVTGLMKAKVNKAYKSNIFKKGLITHSMIVIGLFIFNFYAGDFNIEPLVLPIATAFGGMYISSIYENYKEMGGQAPAKVDKALKDIKENDTEEKE